MITIGKIADRIGSEDNISLLYIGNKSNSKKNELDDDNGYFFDENNINISMQNKTMTKGNYKLTSKNSFINDVKFYTCEANASNDICFRCVSECVYCVSCTTCNSCAGCTSCHTKCVGSCHSCNGCNDCYSYVDGSGH